jgi:hypothetical protein
MSGEELPLKVTSHDANDRPFLGHNNSVAGCQLSLPPEPFAQHAIANRFEKELRDFSCGSKNCEVFNYRSDDPLVSVNDENTKWPLVVQKKDKRLFLVLQTWTKATTEVGVTIAPDRRGFLPAGEVWDVEQNAELPVASAMDFRVSLLGPFGTRALN